MSTLERAIEIAAVAHAGMTDKAGAPYILHPLRVMMSVRGAEAQIVAVLHDVVEDSDDWTLDRVRSEGFSDALVAALDSVTARDGEDYMTFVRRAAGNPIGRDVKLADLIDNCDLTRIANPTQRDFDRIAKYRAAIAWLEETD